VGRCGVLSVSHRPRRIVQDPATAKVAESLGRPFTPRRDCDREPQATAGAAVNEPSRVKDTGFADPAFRPAPRVVVRDGLIYDGNRLPDDGSG